MTRVCRRWNKTLSRDQIGKKVFVVILTRYILYLQKYINCYSTCPDTRDSGYKGDERRRSIIYVVPYPDTSSTGLSNFSVFSVEPRLFYGSKSFRLWSIFHRRVPTSPWSSDKLWRVSGICSQSELHLFCSDVFQMIVRRW